MLCIVVTVLPGHMLSQSSPLMYHTQNAMSHRQGAPSPSMVALNKLTGVCKETVLGQMHPAAAEHQTSEARVLCRSCGTLNLTGST